MNLADLVILIILLIGFTAGLARGFVRGLMGVAGLVLGIMLAAGNYVRLTGLVPFSIPGERSTEIVCFIVIFLVVVILVGIVARIIAKALRLAALGWLDRLAGSALGIAIAASVAGVILLIAVMAGFEEEGLLVDSVMAPRVLRVTDVIVNVLPSEARETVEQDYEKLREQWEAAREKREQEEEADEDDKAVAAPVAFGPGALA